ncbi:DUF3293 domain-containing protein [Shewanella donghaensis]|uniref:DUF3293 domain-containing protein n=1 Tax=Shewanella donghaensis TaxID=238836 RepID=UPI0011839A40|nr:DUF3293 domain-containing protein [Shewanella donghaensis]
MDNLIDSLWCKYQGTHFLLTQRISDGFSFAIITAHNPFGSILAPCQNRLLDGKLQRKIQQYNSPYRSLIGAAPDLSHMEKSWAVFIEKEQALDLGREFKQHAIYYVDNGVLSLLACGDAPDKEVLIGEFGKRSKVVNELPDLHD